ncbi:MAG: cyclodeaminase/cyclohydrolase family protein [Deltaproteobacteria bacterium]|nr:cyclodeaminase/cyclohydrolase family protein [Deltaproteobacteria bacterium]
MKLADLTVSDFIRELASVSPAPGGGSVAALCAGLSAALCIMVARLTRGKEKYRAHWDAMESLIQEADPLTERFVALMDADAKAYNQVVAAMRLPAETEEEKTVRKTAIEQANRKAAEVPLETLIHMLTLADHVNEVVEKGNVNCITDAGTAAQLVRTAAYAAAYNVRINLGGTADPVFAENCRAKVSLILSGIHATIDAAEKKVDSALVVP